MMNTAPIHKTDSSSLTVECKTCSAGDDMDNKLLASRGQTHLFLVLIVNTAVGSKPTKKKYFTNVFQKIQAKTILPRFLFSLHHHNSVMTFSMLTPLINDDTVIMMMRF